mgnify:FL=1
MIDDVHNSLSKLTTLEEAVALSREANKENHRRYINPELVSMMGLIGFDKRFVKAEGTILWDEDGNEYLDFLGGYGALNLGHNHPDIEAAVSSVSGLPNLLQASLNPLAGALARNLAFLTPGDLQYSFFGNSGAEAVEGALKLARAATGRAGILSCIGSFHGKTLGALSVTGRDKYRHPFEPLLPGVSFVPYGDISALESALAAGDIAAFIVEPIQGEGGIIVAPEGYLTEARKLCTAAGTALIIDEIQTGFGRTGKFFACEHEGVTPDIMCISKSFGGGVMPLSAYIASAEIWKRAYGSMEKAMLHTSTFGGNTRAAAAGLTALQIICRDNLPGQAAEKGKYLLEKLLLLKESYPLIRDIRGRGLMIGLEIAHPEEGMLNKLTGGAIGRMAEEYAGAMVAGELLNRHRIVTAYTLNNPSVIRLEPPLNISCEQIDRLLKALEDILSRNKGLGGMALSGAKTALKSLFKQ